MDFMIDATWSGPLIGLTVAAMGYTWIVLSDRAHKKKFGPVVSKSEPQPKQ